MKKDSSRIKIEEIEYFVGQKAALHHPTIGNCVGLSGCEDE